MDTFEFLCTIHNANVRVQWRQGKPDEVYVPCPLCAAEDYKKAREELKTLRVQRDGLLQCIDLKRSIIVSAREVG